MGCFVYKKEFAGWGILNLSHMNVALIENW
jgi:hypothetical protein